MILRNTLFPVCSEVIIENGGAMRDRTADLLRAKQALSQLSYSPKYASTLSTRLAAKTPDIPAALLTHRQYRIGDF